MRKKAPVMGRTFSPLTLEKQAKWSSPFFFVHTKEGPGPRTTQGENWLTAHTMYTTRLTNSLTHWVTTYTYSSRWKQSQICKQSQELKKRGDSNNPKRILLIQARKRKTNTIIKRQPKDQNQKKIYKKGGRRAISSDVPREHNIEEK